MILPAVPANISVPFGSKIPFKMEISKVYVFTLFQIVKMLAVLVLVFGICWFPYHGFFIYSNMDPKILELPYIQHVYLSFYWCAMSHAIVNPVVYCVMNKK